MSPTFVVLGPPRTGSTWLYRCVQDHPNVFVPDVKEVRYFDEHFVNGPAWYEQMFDPAPAGTVHRGDITPGYFSHPETPSRMAAQLEPDAQLFVIVRDPVDRSFSEYSGLLRRQECNVPFADAMLTVPSLVENSLYAKHIGRFLEHFPANRICLLSYDLLQSNPRRYLALFLQELSLPMHEPALLNERVNPGFGDVRTPGLKNAGSGLRRAVERLPYGRDILWKFRDAGWIAVWHRLLRKRQEEPGVDPSIKQVLYQQHFANDQNALTSIQVRRIS